MFEIKADMTTRRETLEHTGITEYMREKGKKVGRKERRGRGTGDGRGALVGVARVGKVRPISNLKRP